MPPVTFSATIGLSTVAFSASLTVTEAVVSPAVSDSR